MYLFISVVMGTITFLDKKESAALLPLLVAVLPFCYTGHIIKQEIIKS